MHKKSRQQGSYVPQKREAAMRTIALISQKAE